MPEVDHFVSIEGLVLMAQSNLMLSAMIFVLSWIVFFGISRLIRMKLTVRLITVALLSLAAASHQLMVYYGGLHVLAVPHFVFYATTFATNLLFFAAPIAGLIYFVVFVRWVIRKSQRKLKARYHVSKRSTRLGRAYSKLRYQLARSKVKERLQRRKAFAQAQAARRAAQELEHLATSQNSLEKNREIQAEHDQLRSVGTITWSSGDADKITYSDGTGNSTVIDTRIYDQHGYRSDLKTNTSASEGARALANSLFGGESDFVDQCTDFDPKTLPGNVEIIANSEDLQRLDESLNSAESTPQTLMQVAAAARATGKRLEQGKLRSLVAKAKSALHHEQGSSYYQELAQRAIEFGMQDEQELSHDHRFISTRPEHKLGFWAKLPWRAIGTSCAVSCLIILNAVAVFSTVQALNMPQVKYVDVTLDVPVEFEGLQIVQLSDLNIGGLYPRSRTTNIVSKVMEMHPDLVVLTGTIAHGDPDLIERRMAPLFGLKASMGVFVLIGDEYNSNLYSQALHRYADQADTNMYFLTNASKNINVGLANLCVTGIADSKSQMAQFLNYATDPTMGLAHAVYDERMTTTDQLPPPPVLTDSARYLAAYNAAQQAESHAWQVLASNELHNPSTLSANQHDLSPVGQAAAVADQIASFVQQRVAARVAKMATIAANHATATNTDHGQRPAASSRATESSRAVAPSDSVPAASALATSAEVPHAEISITPYGTQESQAQSLNSGIAPNSGFLPVADNMMADISSGCMDENGNSLHQEAGTTANAMDGGICEACLSTDPQSQGPCVRATQELMTQATALAGSSNHNLSAQEPNQSLAEVTSLAQLNSELNAVDGSFNPEFYQHTQLEHSKMSPIDAANCPCWHHLHWKENTSHERLLYALTNDSVKRADFNLVLSDSPAYTVALNQLSEDNFDLMLTGSTYGGMAPLLSGWVKNSNGGFVSGMYSITKRMQLYVSSGTNCWAPAPIRLGNSGEITLITVHSRYISDELRSQRIYNFN